MAKLFRDIVSGTLEQPSEVFYERMYVMERIYTEGVVETLSRFMKGRGNDFLIAGVGGILRAEDPDTAGDIDIVAVGLRYFSSRQENDASFTCDVKRAFILLTRGNYVRVYGRSFSDFPGAANEVARVAIGNRKLERRAEFYADIDNFNSFRTKGIFMEFEGKVRPMHIDFTFNLSPQEWKQRQSVGKLPAEAPGKSPLYYSVLSASC